MIYSDKTLSQKLERAEAQANIDFVEARAEMFPASGAGWIEAAGAFAMFDTRESPLTQTFCLGLFEEATHADFERIEKFFKERGAAVFHEVSPLADASLLELLNERGYQPVELSNVLYRTLDAENAPEFQRNPNISTRVAGKDEIEIWAETSVSGWSAEMPEFADFGMELCRVSANSRGALPFIAELGGKPIATASMSICGDVAAFGGASTVPDGRRQGAQTALLDARLCFAADKGCTLAMMSALPGSQSQRNAEKNNFRVAYTRTKWQLKD